MKTLHATSVEVCAPSHLCTNCDVRADGICGAIEPEGLARLEKLLRKRRLARNAVVFHEQDPATHAFIITEGSIRLLKYTGDGQRQVVGFLLRGDFFGFGLTDRYAVTAETLESTLLCQYPRTTLVELVPLYPKLQRKLLSLAEHEIAAMQDQVVLLGTKSAEQRIAAFLLRLYKRMDPARLSPVLEVPMRRLDIAEYLGLTFETTSRVFTHLRERGLLALPSTREVEFKDLPALAALAEGEA